MAIQVEVIVEEIKKEFEIIIERKTGWGKNEIKVALNEAIIRVLAKNLDVY